VSLGFDTINYHARSCTMIVRDRLFGSRPYGFSTDTSFMSVRDMFVNTEIRDRDETERAKWKTGGKPAARNV